MRRIRRHESAETIKGGVAVKDQVEDWGELKRLFAKHRADNHEAFASLGLTMFLWVAGLTSVHLSGGHWAAVTFLGLSMIRCFIVFHDAAHLSFFEDASRNRLLARVLQWFVNYDYAEWDRVHNSHHVHLGDETVHDASLTVFFSQQQLAEKPWPLRLAHRVIRDPLLFFPLAGFFVFFINKMRIHGPKRVLLPLIVWCTLGRVTAIGYLAAAWVAGALGVAAFHLQHGCNTPYRVADNSFRSHLDAAILGSTRIPLCFPLSLFSFGIEYHHIHHLDPRVPGYRLQRCDAEGLSRGFWRRVDTVSAGRAFRSLFHTQFKGSRRVTDANGVRPRFTSFWPYSAMGLQDA
jgi:omega-6 fatty acid desaturase (delta-12 desaturase)